MAKKKTKAEIGPKGLPPLSAKQRRFVEEYLVDLNATKAATRAGYSAKTARSIGCENLTKPNIEAAIAEAMAKRSARTEITQDAVLKELGLLGFSNMQDFVRITADGDPCVDMSDLTREQAAALSEVVVEDFKDGRGEDARDVRRIKIKLSDKRAALVDVGRHLGMFKDRVELTGAEGGPVEIEFGDLTRDERRELRKILSRRIEQSAKGAGSA